MNWTERAQALIDRLASRILVLDGAMGTMIQKYDLKVADFGGEAFEGCNENLVLSRPDLVQEIHESYLRAGADIIETNTFGATPLVLEEFGLGKHAFEINEQAAKMARRLCESHSTIAKPRFVAGSMGPTTKAISVTGGISFAELIEHFEVQAEALFEGGADFFLLETCQDTRNIKAGLIAIDRVLQKKSKAIPVAVSGTIETMGTMLGGQSIDALAVSLSHRELLYLGLNCATGPSLMTDHLRSLQGITSARTAVVPNAGLPDEEGRYLETSEMMAKVLRGFCERGWVNLLGGCCGTTPEHIRAFCEVAKDYEPRKASHARRSFLSGMEVLEINEEVRPVLVGERTNVIGSRLFKDLVNHNRWEEAAEIARRQIKGGAQLIDICLANPDRDEFSDMNAFLERVIKMVNVPLMIDSTDPKVIEMALTYCQGKAIINSINLEDGVERFEAICPLALQYGAALIVGCIDDDPIQGMGISVERKLEIAARSFHLLTEKFHIPPEDIYWDALVFPCGTGDQQYVGSAVQTIKAIAELKAQFPGTKTVLGISNVSFGLPQQGREVLNSVFLYHCVRHGLDLAIVNSEKMERYAQILDIEKKLCDDLLFLNTPETVAAFSNHFRSKEKKKKASKKDLPLDDRLTQAIVEGSKEGLIDDLTEALRARSALQIINGPLMAGMDQVGKLFGENKLIVAEVLQSAEVMKAAVDYLKPFMEKSEEALRGKVILATVKGDVHDIGKNLVDIILSNNGFDVVNLGIKVPPLDLIEAVRKHRPQILGLSGLLVKSAQQMVVTAGDLTAADIKLPILVGGAALTRNFVDKKIAPAYAGGFVEYAKDAMNGLELAKRIVDENEFQNLKESVVQRRLSLMKAEGTFMSSPAISREENRSEVVPWQEIPPVPPDLDRHVVTLPLESVWKWINPLMLYGRHLGLKGNHIRALTDPQKANEFRNDANFEKAKALWEKVETLKRSVGNQIEAKAVYQFFKMVSIGNKLQVGDEVEWTFQRQRQGEKLCLSDYVNPKEAPQDFGALFVAAAVGPMRELADEMKERGDYFSSHALLALALETAEASAEYLHSLLRTQWGFPDAPDMNMMERFQARYRGKRYSFGYPACPELEFQKDLFKLLRPEEIGVQLTEGFMMQPESAVSAIVFSHPSAKYFGVL